MQSAAQRNDRQVSAAIGMRRIALLATAGGLALLALALPVSLQGARPHLGLAGAAAADATAVGDDGETVRPKSGTRPNAQDAINDDTEAAVAESGEPPSQPATAPAAKSRPATTNVIRELSGLPADAELSDEEEREAIRSGWGTWRTADGPETLLAQ